MSTILIFATIILWCMNVHHQYKFDKPTAGAVKKSMNFINGFFSLKYLFPFWAEKEDTPERIHAKKKVNRYLYAFYIFLVLTFITILIEMPATPTPD